MQRALRGFCAVLLAALFCCLMRTDTPPKARVSFSEVRLQEAPAIPNGYAHMETFSTAPAEWRTAGAAVGEIRNRWQCDPRWSFFNLGNDMKVGKPAVLWSKRLFPGDVSVEFYFGVQMDHLRGNPYTYARDVNVTIGSDGSDLRKGCTFSYGGRNNTCSFIQRDGVDLKRLPVRIPVVMDYHLHWYRFRAERYQGKLRFKVDKFFTTEGEKKRNGSWTMRGRWMAIVWRSGRMITRS